ncbi:MAG: methyltransferase domain-containing protein [Planctomycetaceae bacterium]|nr:methyltransferase domain-containing protein [Planctomycetaceae bacterium]
MFDARTSESECLDDLSLEPAFAAQSYRFMRRVNRFLGGTAAVVRFFQAHTHPGKTARVLDLGGGACDIPLAVSRKLNRSGPRVVFTCLETNPTALDIARKHIAAAGDPFVSIVQEDAFEYQPAAAFDFAVGSMFFHHFSDDRILKLLLYLRPFVTKGFFLNDLYRSPLHHQLCRLAVLASAPVIRHDALVSIRRAFTANDLLTLLPKLAPSSLVVQRCWFFRITAAILFAEAAQ